MIKDHGCVVISPRFYFLCLHSDLVWAGLMLISLAILAPSNRMRWLVDRECSGLLVVGG
jgi:hypothetical protein